MCGGVGWILSVLEAIRIMPNCGTEHKFEKFNIHKSIMYKQFERAFCLRQEVVAKASIVRHIDRLQM